MSSSIRVPFLDLRAQYLGMGLEIDEAIRGVVASTDFILGEAVARFEDEFASYIGTKYAVGVGSGLAALELALRACGIGAGDEVITAANSYIATVLAIMAVGAKPVLADVDPATYNLSPRALEAAISPRTRAVIPVHLYGQPADLDSILAIAARCHLLVIEDAAQAHGARYKGKRVGGFGHAAGFSFYPGKNLGAYGDGGMVVTNDACIADKTRQLRNYGQRVKYYHDLRGTNSRLDSMQAAILRVKLKYLDRWNAARRDHAATYERLLAGLDVRPPAATPGTEHIYHLYVVQVRNRDRVQMALRERGIETGIHYPVPIHLQKACSGFGYRPGDFPVTEAASNAILSLPMFPEMTHDQVQFVSDALGQAVALTQPVRVMAHA